MNIKKLTAVLIAALAVSLTACGKSGRITAEQAELYGSMGFVTILGREYDIATTTKLALAGSEVTDDVLKQTAQLTELNFLWLLDTQIGDITPLSGLKQLTRMSLYSNQISDISPLSELTDLNLLRLDDNQIEDITPLSGLTKLDVLGLSGNRISDITPLSELTDLTCLELESNLIEDITPLMGLTNLTELTLTGNQIGDSDIKKLEKKLGNCLIANFSY